MCAGPGISPGRATRYLYCVPPVAVLIGWVWLGEIPTAGSILGGGLAVSGVAIGRATRIKAAIFPSVRVEHLCERGRGTGG